MAAFLDPASVTRTVLPNGLTVLVRPDHSAPVVAIVTLVRAGYFDETDDVVGIAHVLEHMFFKGTPRRGVGEIAKETKSSGGYLNAHTIYDNTTYYTVLPASGFEAGLDIQADAYASSLIDPAELAKELEVIIQEAKRKADNPPALALETLYELLHDRHRMRRWRIGREAGLRALDSPAVRRFYRNFYRPSNTILSIVGAVDLDAALQRIGELYGPLDSGDPVREPGPVEPRHAGFRYRELSGDITQSQLVLGWRTPHSLHEDTPALDFAGALLGTGRGSRLYRAVRERRLASSISAYNYTPRDTGVFVIHAETPPHSTRAAAVAVWEQLRALRDDPIPPDEMERVRRIFASRWIRRFESMEGQATHLAEWEALGDWELDARYYEQFMRVSGDDIHRAAREYLTGGHAGIVAYRPDPAAPVATDAEDMLRVLESERGEPLPPLSPPRSPPPGLPAIQTKLHSTEAGVQVFHGNNGLPILVRPRPGAAVVYLGVFAAGGSREEDKTLAGLTTLTLRTTLKGTDKRSAGEIAAEAEMLGASIGVSLSRESFGWTISVPVQQLEPAADLLGDVVQNAMIPADAFETERRVALAETATLTDDMFRYPVRLATRAAFHGHPYGITAPGIREALESVTVEQARAWYRSRLLGSNLVVAVVGDVVPEDVAGLLARELFSLQPGIPSALVRPTWPESLAVIAETRDKAQTALVIGFPGPARRDESRYASRTVATIASGLGGRFFDELRDRQSLAYTVHAYPVEHELAGAFFAYIATSPEKEEIARTGLLAQFERLRQEAVTQEELERARRYVIGTHAVRQESGGAVLGEMVDSWLFGPGLSEIDEHDEKFSAVTPDDILALARRFFDPDRRAEGVVRGTGRAV